MDRRAHGQEVKGMTVRTSWTEVRSRTDATSRTGIKSTDGRDLTDRKVKGKDRRDITDRILRVGQDATSRQK